MVNRYETLKKATNITTLISIGVIPITIIDWIVIYEYYLDERKSQKKMQSYSNTAENYKLSERQVMNIACWMENIN